MADFSNLDADLPEMQQLIWHDCKDFEPPELCIFWRNKREFVEFMANDVIRAAISELVSSFLVHDTPPDKEKHILCERQSWEVIDTLAAFRNPQESMHNLFADGRDLGRFCWIVTGPLRDMGRLTRKGDDGNEVEGIADQIIAEEAIVLWRMYNTEPVVKEIMDGIAKTTSKY